MAWLPGRCFEKLTALVTGFRRRQDFQRYQSLCPLYELGESTGRLTASEILWR